MGCTPVPPYNPNNICKIYSQYPKWYWASQDAYKKWGISPPVQMAVIYQESRFNAHAKPPRGKILWVIPGKRPTTAKGYTQATNGTWQNYIKNTHNTHASRTNFSDATDFIGWYSAQAHRRLGISPNDTYALYLAYHEGIGGYAKKTYRKKHWLTEVAKKVQRKASVYQKQLKSCQSSLPKRHWWNRLFG